jgi:hypothetical protein
MKFNNVLKINLMKTIKPLIVIFVLSILSASCSKDDGPSATAENTLTFKEKPVTFNGLSIDDTAPNRTSEYIFTTSSGLSMVFYCKYLDYAGTDPRQESADGIVTYTADAVNYLPVDDYPPLTVRGYINFNNQQYLTTSGQVKIKRNDTGNQTFEFVNLKFKAGKDEQLLNGTINLPKS